MSNIEHSRLFVGLRPCEMRGSPSDTGCSQEDLTRQLELSFRGRTLAVNVALNAPVADVLRNVIASCEAILRAEQWNAGKEDTNVRLDPATCKMVVPGRGILDLQKISKNPTQPIST